MQKITVPHDITVLLPVYNGEQFIAEAVESILKQSYTKFELLIINDGSTDRTLQILESLATHDARVRLYSRENRGLIATLNEGLFLCRTELVARMDADDYAMPERLTLQKMYMDAHPQVAVCGSGIITYENGRVIMPPCGKAFDIHCLFASPMAHPTVMYRRSAVLNMGGYAADMPAAEDYDLWVRMVRAGYGLDNLPQPLLRYRTHPNLPRTSYRNAARATTQKIWLRQLHNLGLTPTQRDLDVHGYCATPCVDIPWRIHTVKAWLRLLCAQNKRVGVYNQADLERECTNLCLGFPAPLSSVKNPLRFARRTLRHAIMTFCYDTGPVGRSVERTIRSYVHSLRILRGKG
ncbi:glycosyltransferase [uncultured Desulfovibrio sp.]|uniref:glycosyltransferase n=1 Tax=uncultured Desulfovibrio sp. TaxID=167968 RepID=UPI002671B820|nr:glycosyltransferase [uncultured Desulfovibrio sp.]